MFCVYWTEDNVPKSYMCEELKEVLVVSEEKRSKGFKFISISSEIENNVTKMGVAEPSADYSWKKRRI